MPRSAIIGQPAPELELDNWLQGEAMTLQQLRGQVVLILVFQVNCPGCFLHALPEVAQLHTKYASAGLHIIGLATAFEDFAQNTQANLRLLVEHGELCGAPLQQLGQTGLLDGNKIDFEMPFAIASDRLSECHDPVSEASIMALIDSQIENYTSLPIERQQHIYESAMAYLQARTHRAHSFERYQLQGTPSAILIDRAGLVRDISFGRLNHLETLITPLLKS